MKNRNYASSIVGRLLGLFILAGLPQSEAQADRSDDEIIVAGKRFHTGTPIVTWLASDGYNGYQGSPAFSFRQPTRSVEETQQLQATGWDLPALQKVVDQFVLHYDGHGLSKTCFGVLRERGLSVHFLLDLDGTVYQTLDLQERALHATTSNDRSIGIEIANLGAFPLGETKEFDEWYQRDKAGQVYIRVPGWIGDAKIHTKPFVGRPARSELIQGSVQNSELVQYDFTPEQYAALIKLTAALCRLFPQIRCDYPRDAAGQLITHKLPDEQLAGYKGILGHFHIQTNKTDPGPALQWAKLVDGAKLLSK